MHLRTFGPSWTTSRTCFEPKKAERSTGYVVGGISLFGQRKHLRTFIDASALTLDEIVVNGGLQIVLEPKDLIVATSAVAVPLRS
jgi:Cys-tRNA(Pro)/Cys-tRNA(Cys) deacylase